MLYSKTECPVEDFDRVWINNALLWFEQKLGKAFIKNRKILIPADCRFDYQYFNSHEAIQYFIEFICNYIDLDASLIAFELFWDDSELDVFEDLEFKKGSKNLLAEFEVNQDGKYEIIINENNLSDFDGTFIDLTYKLTYVKLMKEKVFAFENGYMINYAMVLYGFGILMANTFIRTEQWGGVRYSAWKVRRLGLLNHRMYGYMFALLCRTRDEIEITWQKYLCTDVYNFYFKSVKFLEEQTENEIASASAGVTVKDEAVFFKKYLYEGGGIYITAFVINKKFEGLATFYHENGVLWSERIYKNGIPFTVLSNYNSYNEEVEKGTLFEGNGTLYIYRKDGNLEVIETYKDGVKIKEEKTQ